MDLFNWSLIAANEGPKVLMNKTITEDEPKSAFLVLSFLPVFFLPWELKWTTQIQVIRRRHLLPRIKHDISPFFPYCCLRFMFCSKVELGGKVYMIARVTSRFQIYTSPGSNQILVSLISFQRELPFYHCFD
jgi:hypothetical protein